MKKYKFSPIESKEQLIKAIEHTHFECFRLCHKALGKYLPVAGNIGVFSHYDNEFEFLTKLGEELTNHNVPNFNGKYFRLHEPIKIGEKDDIPETTYEYLYIRKPDGLRSEVGDVDFVIKEDEFEKIKNLKMINGIEIFYRPDLGMCGFSDPDFDVLPFLTTKTVADAIAT